MELDTVKVLFVHLDEYNLQYAPAFPDIMGSLKTKMARIYQKRSVQRRTL